MPLPEPAGLCYKEISNMPRVALLLLLIVGFALVLPFAAGQKRTMSPDLSGVPEGKGWILFNRSATLVTDGERRGVRLSEMPGDGAAWLQGVEFEKGSIEFDVRGKDVFQRSFLGIAFHALDDKTYDAIYFRPFNFRNQDPERRSHAVQYISHPSYTWQRLRTENPGQYEKPVEPAPDPNGWFHAQIVVTGSEVKVYVNGAATPALVVKQLSSRGKGKLGLWCGNTSGGDFANLRIIPEQ